MTTTTTLQGASKQENWTLAAKLVSKLIFVKKTDGSIKIGLILVFIDTNGQSFEIQTWSTREYDRRRKIFTVYRKVHENDCYEIRSTRSGYYFRSPKVEFSTAKLIYSRGWWIEPIDNNSLRINRYLDCSTNIQSSIGTLQQSRPINLLGSYISHKEGPSTHYVAGRPSVQGYFVTLADENGQLFVALVWHSVRIDRNKFSLFHCEVGDPVLIFAARSGYPSSGCSKDLTCVTSTYQPVVNSKCVSPKRINALTEGFRSARES